MTNSELVLTLIEIIVIPVALAATAYYWPVIQETNRRRAFEGLILRELSEIAPHPPLPTGKEDGWWMHQKKRFIHQQIFAQPTENRDFILSLDPDLVYFVSQLWQAKEDQDWEQWDYSLGKLSQPCWDMTGRIGSAHEQWTVLCQAYAGVSDQA